MFQFSPKHFKQVSLTSTLVMYTLYGSVSSTLPVNGSIKAIDIWLVHGLLNPFIVFLVLVTSKLLSQHSSSLFAQLDHHVTSVSSIDGLPALDWKRREKRATKDLGERFQNWCKVVMPLATMAFFAIFFIAAFLGPK